MPRGKRRKVAPNIYADNLGLAAVFTMKGQREEKRFPPGTPIQIIQRYIDTRSDVLKELAGATPERGSLSATIADYTKTLAKTRKRDREQLLKPWADALGHVAFFALTRRQLQDTADTWIASGTSTSRVNKRISAIRQMWQATAPDHPLPHPIEKLTRYPEPPPTTRGAPLDLINRALETFPPCQSTARLKVMAWTGQPPSRIAQIKKEHVRWKAQPPELYVSPRRKGTGSADAWLPLLPQAVDALREFFAHKATGPFQMSPLGRFWRRHLKALKWPVDDKRQLLALRVYDLRHSFLTEYGKLTQDIYAVAEYAGHSNLQTTRRYMRGAASSRMTQGIDALAKHLPRGT
jgi:integrase